MARTPKEKINIYYFSYEKNAKRSKIAVILNLFWKCETIDALNDFEEMKNENNEIWTVTAATAENNKK